MNNRGSHPVSTNMGVGEWYRKYSGRPLESGPYLIEGVKLVEREQGVQLSRRHELRRFAYPRFLFPALLLVF